MQFYLKNKEYNWIRSLKMGIFYKKLTANFKIFDYRILRKLKSTSLRRCFKLTNSKLIIMKSKLLGNSASYNYYQNVYQNLIQAVNDMLRFSTI